MAGKHDRAIKRLLVSYKQRDTLDKSKRGVFYCLFAKMLYSVADVSEAKSLRILSTTAVDLKHNAELQDLP